MCQVDRRANFRWRDSAGGEGTDVGAVEKKYDNMERYDTELRRMLLRFRVVGNTESTWMSLLRKRCWFLDMSRVRSAAHCTMVWWKQPLAHGRCRSSPWDGCRQEHTYPLLSFGTRLAERVSQVMGFMKQVEVLRFARHLG